MTERYNGNMIKKVGVFFEDVLKVNYTPCDTFIVPKDEINLISPPKGYPNPKSESISEAIEKTGFLKVMAIINEAYELFKNKNRVDCERGKCVLKCKKFHKRLLESYKIIKKISELINSSHENKEPEVRELVEQFNNTLVDTKSKDGLNKKLNGVKKQMDKIKKPTSDLHIKCPKHGDCKIIYDILEELIEIDAIIELSLPNPLPEPTVPIPAIGLYLNNNHGQYRKGSVLISKDIIGNQKEFEQTFVHEHTHAMLHKEIQGNVILKNKGLNEGFAVAMEYFYDKKNFDEKRYGEYLAHQILTILENPNKPRELFEELKKKYGC
jgi:hypothetical protein